MLCNAPDLTCAERLAQGLISEQLAACVNLLSPVQSIYRWQGQIEQATEISLLCKTTATAYPAVERYLQQHHPYETPEIIAWPVAAGLPAYLTWVNTETISSQGNTQC